MFIYSIYDKKGNFFTNSFFDHSNAEAVRKFARLSNDSRTDVNMWPDEFALYCVGKFDPDNGTVAGVDPVKFVVDAISLLDKQPVKDVD